FHPPAGRGSTTHIGALHDSAQVAPHCSQSPSPVSRAVPRVSRFVFASSSMLALQTFTSGSLPYWTSQPLRSNESSEPISVLPQVKLILTSCLHTPTAFLHSDSQPGAAA